MAQWTKVADKLIGQLSIQTGSIYTKDGLIWAGSKLLYLSTDNGTSWQPRTPPLYSNDGISDINFYNSQLGLVATKQGFIYLTQDQGQTWRELYHPQSSSSVCFLGSPQNILVAGSSSGLVEISNDQGQSWRSVKLGNYLPQVLPLIGGEALALAGSNAANGLNIYYTNDYGATWQKRPGTIDGDTWSFAADPCNSKYIYIANEEGSISNNGAAEIVVSSDKGNSWKATFSQPRLYISGSVSVSSNAVYFQTINNGIYRSTDLGVTWKPVGGPASKAFDTRTVCAVTDNLVIAADGDGSLYRTFNGGTDSVSGPSRSQRLVMEPTSLFETDTLYSCDAPVTKTIVYDALFCFPPRVLKQWISGDDSLDYTIIRPAQDTLLGTDSIKIKFFPGSSGDRRSSLKLLLSDSNTLIIPLYGFGRGITTLNIGTVSYSNDTIGASIFVPLKLTAIDSVNKFSVVLHYPDSSLIYLGTKDSLGNTLDQSNESWPGRSKLFFTVDSLPKDSILCYSEFQIKAGKERCQIVTFDSITVSNNAPDCALRLGEGVTATLCYPEGCGVQAITQFMQQGTFELFTIRMDYAANSLEVKASENRKLQSIQVLNTLGMIQKEFNVLNAANYTFSTLPFSNGVYFVQATMEDGSRYVQPIRILKP